MSAPTVVLLGQNNAGKSNALRLVHQYVRPFFEATRDNAALHFDVRTDPPRNVGGGITVDWPIDAAVADARQREVVERLLKNDLFMTHGRPALRLKSDHIGPGALLDIPGDYALEVLNQHAAIAWSELSLFLSGTAGGPPGDDVKRVLRSLRSFALEPPRTLFVPPARSISPGADHYPSGEGDQAWDFSGRGLIDRIHQLLNPQYDDDASRSLSLMLTGDLRFLLEDPELEINVPFDRSTINVRLAGHFYPLGALGTGTEHAIVLVLASRVYRDVLLCIEEPDAHMHPVLQRRLMTLLARNEVAGTLITTHSAHIVDVATTSIIAVRKVEGRSELHGVAYPDLFDELQALGYRASDLLQANAIIWVEGPSDRVYLLYWLRTNGANLQEGVDFSIVFYGGALLARLAIAPTDDPAAVDLWRVNQNAWLIMDSDRQSGSKPLKPAVERMLEGMRVAPRGGAWLTAGYTIENYIERDVLLSAVKVVHPSVVSLAADGDPLLHMPTTGGGRLSAPDKVAIAETVVSMGPSLEVSDLQAQMDRLIMFLEAARVDRPVDELS